MIHHHGGPITPATAAFRTWTGRHAFVSCARTEQTPLAAEVCQSFALDNGAFSLWRAGTPVDWHAFYGWVADWRRHPGFDFAVVPDVIDGSEAETMRSPPTGRSRGMRAPWSGTSTRASTG